MGKDKYKAKAKLFVEGTRVPVVTVAQPAGMSVQMPLPAKAAQGEFAQKEVKATISLQEEIDTAMMGKDKCMAEVKLFVKGTRAPVVTEAQPAGMSVQMPLPAKAAQGEFAQKEVQEEIVHVPKVTLSTAQVHENWMSEKREQLASMARPARCRR